MLVTDGCISGLSGAGAAPVARASAALAAAAAGRAGGGASSDISPPALSARPLGGAAASLAAGVGSSGGVSTRWICTCMSRRTMSAWISPVSPWKDSNAACLYSTSGSF